MTRNCDVLCAGIVVADHVCTPIDHLPVPGELVRADEMLLTLGGCAANVAVGLTKMRHTATIAGRVGQDVLARVVTELLRESRVSVAGLQTTADADTSQTLIVNVAGEDRRFIHSFGANALFRAKDIWPDLSSSCKILYLGGYLVMPKLRPEELAPVFEDARRHGVRTVLDVVTPGPGDYVPLLRDVLPHVDYFLPNNLEGELILGEKDPVRQADRFREMGVGTTVITMGEEGTIVVSESERLRAGVFDVPFVDGSGGGDAFTAGFLTGLLKDMDLVECVRRGSALGASCVQAVGTTTGVFTREECESFLGSHTLKIDKLGS